MSNLFGAINPATNELISEYQYTKSEDLEKIIETSFKAYQQQLDVDYSVRAQKLIKVADLLDERVEEYAKLLTAQMGKPIAESRQEVQKCAKHCRYYAEKADEYLKPQPVKTEADSSYVHLEPLGPIYQIIPFNFPFWLSFKSAVPMLLLGDTVIHRNAKTCADCGLALEKLYKDAGFTNGEFINVFTDHKQTEYLLSRSEIRGVTFTGSSSAGATIASLAGKNLKKCVMELGGSDAVIVLDDADLESASKLAIQSRLRNGGQTCTAGKRFIINEKVFDQFLEKLLPKVKDFSIGNPLNESTKLGPLSSKNTVESIHKQVEKGIKEGGKVLLEGGQPTEEEFKKGNFYRPYVIEVSEDNVLFKEETFGPVFAVIKAKDDADSLRLANSSEYGLGGVVLGTDRKRTEKIARRLEAGFVSVNQPVKSDARLPSGGVKSSGFGRECGLYGVMEFANIKAIWID